MDDLLRGVFQEIIDHGETIQATSGTNLEIRSVALELTRPRARLSSTESRGRPLSCLGELCWYLAASDDADFIEYYIPKGHYGVDEHRRVPGAYGPRLFGTGEGAQVANTINLLRKKRSSRQAVIQLFDARDQLSGYQPPCTCTLQFFIRSDCLELVVHMRSNDAYLGFPHDVFCFTMLQELIASELNVGLSNYSHFVGSLHLYDDHLEDAQSFLDEGWQSTKAEMDPMPGGSPWSEVQRLLDTEKRLRTSEGSSLNALSELDPYWADLNRLLFALKYKKEKKYADAAAICDLMSSDLFLPFIQEIANKPGRQDES